MKIKNKTEHRGAILLKTNPKKECKNCYNIIGGH